MLNARAGTIATAAAPAADSDLDALLPAVAQSHRIATTSSIISTSYLVKCRIGRSH